MNTLKQLIAASATVFVAAGAFAQEATPDTWAQVAATKSRAQVAGRAAAGPQGRQHQVGGRPPTTS